VGPFIVKGTKSLVDYGENYTSTILKNHQSLQEIMVFQKVQLD